MRPLLIVAIVFSLFSCEKENSLENSQNVGNELIVGVDCRLRKMVYTDTATKVGLGSLDAAINSLDMVTKITRFDSLSNTIEFITTPIYSNDTVFINPDEYFVVDVNKRISKLHGLIDPTDPFSLQFDVLYAYSVSGYLGSKTYALTTDPLNPYKRVDYVYTGNNLTHMTATDLTNGDLNVDADIDYYNQIIPRRFLYIFPDEKEYPYFSQFYNYGLKNYNAIKKMTVRYYDPGNVLRDSTVSNFSNYIMSRDTYVLSVQMEGADQQSIPALAGKLSFSYHCK